MTDIDRNYGEPVRDVLSDRALDTSGVDSFTVTVHQTDTAQRLEQLSFKLSSGLHLVSDGVVANSPGPEATVTRALKLKDHQRPETKIGTIELQVRDVADRVRVSADPRVPYRVQTQRELVLRPKIESGPIRGSQIASDDQAHLVPEVLASLAQSFDRDEIGQVRVETKGMTTQLVKNLVTGTGRRNVDDFSSKFDLDGQHKIEMATGLVEGGLWNLAQRAVGQSIKRGVANVREGNGPTQRFEVSEGEYDYVVEQQSIMVIREVLNQLENSLKADANEALWANRSQGGRIPAFELSMNPDSKEIRLTDGEGNLFQPGDLSGLGDVSVQDLLASLPLTEFAKLGVPKRHVAARIDGKIVSFPVEGDVISVGDQILGAIVRHPMDLVAKPRPFAGGERTLSVVGDVLLRRRPAMVFEPPLSTPRRDAAPRYSSALEQLQFSSARRPLRGLIMTSGTVFAVWGFGKYIDAGFKNDWRISGTILAAVVATIALRVPKGELRTRKGDWIRERESIKANRQAGTADRAVAASRTPVYSERTSEISGNVVEAQRDASLDMNGNPLDNASITPPTASAEMREANGSPGDV